MPPGTRHFDIDVLILVDDRATLPTRVRSAS